MNNNDFIDMFEKELSIYTGAPYVVLTDSCTNAIFLTLKYIEQWYFVPLSLMVVDIPKNTYVGVAHSIINAGFHLSFNNKEWNESYQLGDLPIRDCAVAFYKDMYIPGQYQCLSFQQKKRLNIGKGGAILLDNEEAYIELKKMAFDGRNLNGEIDDTMVQGYHMNMIPDDAARGLLILNQINLRPYNKIGYRDYPNISDIPYFNNDF